MQLEEIAPAGGADIEIGGEVLEQPTETPDESIAGGAGTGGNTAEDSARAKGWRPKEEYVGDGDWVDAEEFLRRKPFFDKMSQQRQEIKRLQRTVESMATHYHKSVAAAVDKAVKNLKVERREAIELGDADRVDAIDAEIAYQQQQMAAQPANTVAPEIVDWVAENPWFNNDSDMRSFAVAFNENYLKANPNDIAASLDKTLSAVKKAFPEKFEQPVRKPIAPASPVESGAVAHKPAKYDVNRLTSEQKAAYNAYVKQHKIMSHDEYFQGLEVIGDYK